MSKNSIDMVFHDPSKYGIENSPVLLHGTGVSFDSGPWDHSRLIKKLGDSRAMLQFNQEEVCALIN